MEIIERKIIELNLDYQDYSTYLAIIWTIAISLFIAFFSYILTFSENIKTLNLIILSLILIFIEVIFIAIHFYITRKKDSVRNKLNNLN